jgi:hypothetical protein
MFLFILHFILLDFILIVFSGGQRIELFVIQPLFQVQSFSSDLYLATSSKSVLLLQNEIKFLIHIEYLK